MKLFAKFAGGLGLIFIIFGTVAALISGGPIRAVGLSQLIVGAIGVGIFLAYYLGETMTMISQKRQAIMGVLGGLIVLAILIGVNVVAQSQFGERQWDMTVNRVHSLAAESEQMAKSLSSDIEVIAFFDPGQRESDALKSMVKKYSALTTHLNLKIYNPDEEPSLVKELSSGPGEVILRHSTTKRTIKLLNVTEEAFTNAIKKVLRDQEKKIYFLTGAGQSSMDEKQTPDSLFVAKFKLEAEGFKALPLNLNETKKIPQDAAVIASFGAKRAFSPLEAQLLEHYLEHGGQLIVAQDPNPTLTKDKLLPTGLETVFEKYGLRVAPAITIDVLNLGQGPKPMVNIFAYNYSQHPIVSKFTKENVTMFPFAMPVLATANYKGKAKVSSLVDTTVNSWGETNVKSILVNRGQGAAQDAGDVKGPFSIAQISEWKVEKPEKGDWGTDSKLLIIGNAQFATTQFIEASFNLDFFANIFSYVAGDNVSPLSIRPRNFKQSTLQMTDDQRKGVYYASLFILPELILIMSLLVWLLRRARV